MKRKTIILDEPISGKRLEEICTLAAKDFGYNVDTTTRTQKKFSNYQKDLAQVRDIRLGNLIPILYVTGINFTNNETTLSVEYGFLTPKKRVEEYLDKVQNYLENNTFISKISNK